MADQQQEPKRGWWSRNWKWFVPCGCLSMIALAVVFVAVLVLTLAGAMKSNDAYRGAMAQANASAEVQQALGSPLKAGMFVSGNINVSGASGQANLSIPVSGPKGAGTLYVEATKSAGQWTYSTLTLEVKATGERIDLLQSLTAPVGGGI